MSQDTKNKNTNFVQRAINAEENSAAAMGEHQLSKFNNIAIRMFHTNVLTPREMIFPAMGEFATRLLSGITYYRTLYFVNVLKSLKFGNSEY